MNKNKQRYYLARKPKQRRINTRREYKNDTYDRYIYWVKNGVICIFALMIPIYICYIQPHSSIRSALRNIQNMYNAIFTQLFIGLILCIAFAWFLHYIAYIISIHNNKRPATLSGWNFWNVFGFVFSPDYYFAKKYKKDLNKFEKRILIQCSNWLNITFTCLASGIFIFYYGNIPLFIKYFFAYRLLSRCSEITYAFYRDIIDPSEKTSKLTPGERISLAIHSFFEVILLYGIVYYLFFKMHFLEGNHFISHLIYSGTVSTFNFGFSGSEGLMFKYVVLTQVMVSLNLVVLSLAGYLGLTNNK